MNLLFDDIEVLETVGDPFATEVGGISHDSRRVVPGDLFCCVPGEVSDGHRFAREAVERGAIGVLCEHFIPELLQRDVTQARGTRGGGREHRVDVLGGREHDADQIVLGHRVAIEHLVHQRLHPFGEVRGLVDVEGGRPAQGPDSARHVAAG